MLKMEFSTFFMLGLMEPFSCKCNSELSESWFKPMVLQNQIENGQDLTKQWKNMKTLEERDEEKRMG